MEVMEAIRRRRSIGRLAAPPPTAADLRLMLEAAVLAPDHKELRPWRFVVIEGDARTRLGEVMADARLRRNPDATPGQLEKDRTAPLRAPMIVAVAAKRVETALPFAELVAATCAGTENLLLAATALGYGSIWRTGEAARDPNVKAALGLEAEDEIVGLVYLGTNEGPEPPPREPSLEGVVSHWPG